MVEGRRRSGIQPDDWAHAHLAGTPIRLQTEQTELEGEEVVEEGRRVK